MSYPRNFAYISLWVLFLSCYLSNKHYIFYLFRIYEFNNNIKIMIKTWALNSSLFNPLKFNGCSMYHQNLYYDRKLLHSVFMPTVIII
jgi:hypothetical protein